MNRPAAPAEASLVPDTTRFASQANYLWEADLWDEVSERPTNENVATFAPVGYEPGYAYPLIVWLHGNDSNEDSLPLVMRHISTRNYVAVAPGGLETAEGERREWVQTSEGIAEAEQAVSDAIEAASSLFNVNPDRVFIMGVGAGGSMALRLALQRPEWFGGVLSLDGPMPEGHCPLGRVNEARSLPLLLSASRESEGYPEARLCRDLELLHSAGFHVALRLYPGSDDLTTAMLADANRWIMERVTGRVEAEQEV